jgi:glucosamine-6-phosphate deaminase
MKIYFLSSNTKKGVLFQGDDRRDFWVRAEDRNHSSVKKFSTIVFADYEVI